MKKVILAISTMLMMGCQTRQFSSNHIEKSWVGHSTKELKANRELNGYKKQEVYIDDINKTITYSYEYKKVTNSFDCLNQADPLHQRIYDRTLSSTCEENTEVTVSCSYTFYIQNDIINKYEKQGDQCPSSCKVSFEGCN